MIWNWQQPHWPEFSYDSQVLTSYEAQFLQRAGFLSGSLKHVSTDDQDILKVELISAEAFKTSEIEGELLNRESLQSSVQRQFGLRTEARKISPAEQGIAEIMVDLYRHYATQLDHDQLLLWHAMLMRGRRDVQTVGAYRVRAEPMQIVSGPPHKPKIHFEAPPSERVAREMKQFIFWFNNSKDQPTTGLLAHAGIAHLYFESIHPFEDGNGRIGRAISEKSLSQGLGRPTLIALAHVMERKRKDYYAALQRNSRNLEITDWLIYFCETVLAGQDYTQAWIDFLIAKGRFYQRFADQLNQRQAKVIARIFREGIEGFKGGLSAENYISITRTSRATATRDLQNLVRMGAMNRKGERRYARYSIALEQ